jgi:hypothetical protein
MNEQTLTLERRHKELAETIETAERAQKARPLRAIVEEIVLTPDGARQAATSVHQGRADASRHYG